MTFILGSVGIAMVIVMFLGMYNWNGEADVKAMLDQECGDDELFNTSFVSMDKYLTRIQGAGFKTTILVFTCIISIIKIGGFIYKYYIDEESHAVKTKKANKMVEQEKMMETKGMDDNY